MVSLESIVLGAFALVLLGIGYALVFRVETALAFQRRYAEAVSSTPPSEHPEYYEETSEHRKGVFWIGGAVLLAVGASLLAMAVYGEFLAGSFPS